MTVILHIHNDMEAIPNTAEGYHFVQQSILIYKITFLKGYSVFGMESLDNGNRCIVLALYF